MYPIGSLPPRPQTKGRSRTLRALARQSTMVCAFGKRVHGYLGEVRARKLGFDAL